MPEPVELRVRGGERGRVPVAERDDGDAGGEVEVALAVAAGEPDAVAFDEAQPRRRVRRQQCAREQRVHATTAVAPISATSPLRAAFAAASSLGTMPPSKLPWPTSCTARAAGDRLEQPALVEDARHVGEEEDALRPRARRASAAAASSALTLSGPRASGETTGTRPAASACSTAAGRRRHAGGRRGRARGSSSASRPISSPSQPDRVRPDLGAQAGVDRPRSSRARPRAQQPSSRAGRRRSAPRARAASSRRRSAGRRRARRRRSGRARAAPRPRPSRRSCDAPPTLSTTVTSGTPR